MADDSLDDDLLSPNSQDQSFLSDEGVQGNLVSSLASTRNLRLAVVRVGGVAILPRIKFAQSTPTPFSHDNQSLQISVLESTVASLRAALSSQESDLRLENQLLREQIDRLRSEFERETRVISSEEVKKLRQTLEEKTKKIASLQRLVPVEKVKPTNWFAFLSSELAQTWTSICASVSRMSESVDSRDTVSMAAHLESLLEQLDTKALASNNAAEILVEVSLNATKALNQAKVPWERVGDLVKKAEKVCQEEAQRLGRPEAPAPKSDPVEEYLSDYSDEDFSVEVEEEEQACQVVPQLQASVHTFQYSHSGPISPQGLFELLSLRVLEASEASLEAFVRRLKFAGGTVVFEDFVRDVRSRSPQWWLKTLASTSFDLQHQVREGTFVQLPAWSQWVHTRLRAKLHRYISQERITTQQLAARVFFQDRLTKRELRHVLRELSVPVNREDCHALFRLLDGGDGYATSAAFAALLTTDTVQPQPPVATDELAAISERDARFRLIQAEQRIRDLEQHQMSYSPNSTREHTLALQLSTLQKDYDLLLSQLDSERHCLHTLQQENDSLQHRISTLDQAGPTSAPIDLDQYLSEKLRVIDSDRKAELAEIRRRHEEEKAGLVRLVKNKNRELETLGGEVDRLLRDLAEIRNNA